MRVIGVSGSPRKDGNTDRLVREVLAGAAASGAETRFIRAADARIQGCVSCYHCRGTGVCALHDDMAEIFEEILKADVVVLGSPVYMGQMCGQLKVFVDRMLPVLAPDYSSRLIKHPRLFFVYTQGNPKASSYQPYMEQTCAFFKFIGFTPKGFMTATGTREKDDMERLPEVKAEARARGAGLVAAV